MYWGHSHHRLAVRLPRAAEFSSLGLAVTKGREHNDEILEFSDSIAIYHGKKDTAVPIAQAESIVKALRENGTPHHYHVYENEGHGWRDAKNIAHFYENVLEFLVEKLVLS